MNDYDTFISAPSERLLRALTRNQMFDVVNHYGIDLSIPKSSKKEELCEFILQALMERQILQETTQQEAVAPKMTLWDGSDLTFEQRKELLLLQREQMILEHEQQMRKQKLELQARESERLLEYERLKCQERSREQHSLFQMVKFLPNFNERDPDVFFSLFEHVLADRGWTDADKVLLLQKVLVGKGQEAFVALSPSEKLSYQCVKAAVLKAYELIPEHYRQRFRTWKKTEKQTHVDVARELISLCNRWCTAVGVKTFQELFDLVVLEQFKNIVPERIATHINEHQIKTAAQAAVLADEFVLTHKSFRDTSQRDYVRRERTENEFGRLDRSSPVKSDFKNTSRQVAETDNKCRYCYEVGHWKRDCPVLNSRIRNSNRPRFPKPVGCTGSLQSKSVAKAALPSDNREALDKNDYSPFITQGTVSLVGDTNKVKVNILRDTGSATTLIREDVLNFSDVSDTGARVLIRGIDLQPFSAPLHKIELTSGLVNGTVVMAVHKDLPVEGVDILLGNNLAGGRVWPESPPPPVVNVTPSSSLEFDECAQEFPSVFTSCALTRAKAKIEAERKPPRKEPTAFVPVLPPSLHRDDVVAAQKEDASLSELWASVTGEGSSESAYRVQNGLLLREWSPPAHRDVADPVMQVVVPRKLRDLVLKTAHGDVAGHFGVNKTYLRILEHFYWPKIKRDVSAFIKSCHICQIAGKPNEKIKPAPLQPIQPVEAPFHYLVIDCVGPLPPSKSGNAYLFTVMCQTTRYPAAYPMRSITTKSIFKALSHFISYFGIPKIVQSDRGSNFMSKAFSEALKKLRVKHNISSAYHPQSQGVLERYHASLKSLLKAYSLELKRGWEEGLPWLMLAARGVVQESTGFSPNELVFGHKVRDQMSVLMGDLDPSEQPGDVADYVSGFRRKLFLAWKMASSNLTAAQKKMKHRFDSKAEMRMFSPGDRVLALLPIPGSPFEARFSGPYTIKRKTSDTDYLLATPDCRRSTQLCHVNLLKPYYDRGCEKAVALAAEGVPSLQVADEDDVVAPDEAVLLGRLDNSRQLAELDKSLSHLSSEHSEEIKSLISEFSSLFTDKLSCTDLLEHDIDVGDSRPIRQRFYRVSPEKNKILEESVQYLLSNGLAEPSFSSWASPCLLVRKPDLSYRFCTDYRKVNAVTKPDSFPLPRIDDCVDQVGAARYVSKFDLVKGYYQIGLTPRAQEISAFITPSGLFSYKVMAFGLRNGPATFQRLMNRVVAGLSGCAVYLDDIVVFSDTWADHLVRLRALFQKLVMAKLTINLAKCEFARATVTYLGKVVGRGKVRPVSAKVQAIDAFPSPTTKKELMRFLGMVGYYRNFCVNFSTVVSPLTDLLKGNSKFHWSECCQRAFDNAKLLLSSAPVLAAPRLGEPFQLQVDASQVGAGAVLMQKDEQTIERPVCFFSRKFNKHQINYSVIEKEAIALIWALKHFEVYVGGGAPVVVYSDHNPLTFLSSLQNANQRLMRWALFLQPYNIEIKHIRGVDNVMADALSRAPCDP
uniref:Gypsy retrotransposon integrase-like protein 1 n=1 Tax=Takifugu rubripes TaxID=31033 RepID=A0A674PAM1_TAKRU